MIKSKNVFIFAYLLISLYAIIASLTRDVSEESNWCSYQTIKAAAPWTSGCFYMAYYSNDTVSDKQLGDEVKQLSSFAKKGGMAADIHLYKLQLHIKHQTRLKANFQDIHTLYLNYTKAEHHNIKIQTEYLHFLHLNQLGGLAQTTLDKYCDKYLFRGRVDIVDEMKWRLAEKQVPANLTRCYDVANSFHKERNNIRD